MIKSIIMLCAEGIVRDGESNNISAYNIFEQFATPGFPLLIPKLYVFNLLERDDDDPTQLDCRVIVKNNDTELVSLPIRVDFLDKMRNRTIITIGGLAVRAPGILKASILLGEQELDSYIIKVISNRPPEETGGNPKGAVSTT